MSPLAHKGPDNTQSPAAHEHGESSSINATSGFTDNRKERTIQRQLQELANKSRQVNQLREHQELVSNGQRNKPPVQFKNGSMYTPETSRSINVFSLRPDLPKVAQRKAKVLGIGAEWAKGPLVDSDDVVTRGKNANLEIRVSAVLSNKDGNNPAHADYRQYVKDKWEITAPAHRKSVLSESGWHDDNYSRADNRSKMDNVFSFYDYPGLHHSAQQQDGLLRTDELKASFSAKQEIFDTSDENKVIAQIPEHTATIEGAHPRDYTGLDHVYGEAK